MADDRIDVKVGATTGELKTGMDQSQSIVKQGVAGMQTPFERMQQSVATGMSQMHSEVKTSLNGVVSSLSAVGKMAVGIGAILAGGAIFKGLIQDTVDYVSEAKKLHETTNININDAAAMILAYKRVGVDSDALGQALRRFMMQVKTNSEGMKTYGLDVDKIRSQGGGLMDMFEKSKEVIGEYTKGYDQQQAMMYFWGTRIQDGTKILKVHTDQVADAKKFLESLGLTIGPDMEAQIRKFKQGLVDTETLLLAIKFMIAQQVVPELIKLQGWFAGEGGSAIKTFTGLVNGLGSAFGSLKISMGWIYDSLNVWEKLSKAASATQKVINDIKGKPANSGDMGAGSHGGDWGETQTAPAGGGGKKWPGGTGGGGGKGGGASLVQQWVAELEQMKAAEERFQSQSLQMEKAFWAKKLATGKVATQEELEALKSKEHDSEAVRLRAEADFWKGKLLLAAEGSKDYQEVQHKIFTLEQQQNKLRLQSEIELIKSKIKAGQDAIKDKMALIEHENQLEKLNLEMKQANVAHLAKMGAMSRLEELRQYKNLKKEEHLIYLKAAQDKAIAEKGDLEAYKKHLKDIELLKKKQALELKKIDFDITQAMKAQWGQVWNAVSQAFNMSVQGIITGTTTLADAIKNIWQSILTSLAGMFLQIALEYIASEIMMLVFGKAAAKEKAASEIGAQAGIAGAAGVASVMVAVPFPANIALAPKVGFAAAALAGAFGFLASAAGGWDVPHDTLAMVHKDEKILPADWPQKLRAVAAPAVAGGPGNMTQHLKIQVVTPDGRTILEENKTLFFELSNQGIKHGEIRIPARR